MRKRIPNILSLSRVVIGVIVLVLSAHLTTARYTAMIALVALAMLTDYLDGHLARRWNVASDVGYVLDTLGDRAIHLSLTLVVLVRYSINPLIVWLLVFRDIGIYAVRVLSMNWLAKSKKARWMSLLHATAVRIWLGLFLVRDGFRVYLKRDLFDRPWFDVVQLLIITLSIAFSYYALARSFDWIIDDDHASL
ncbi:MAG: CDP-diacylglycerol---glycerol-3-phosphate 3-phosphatidyltransferase [Thermoanaerobaculia bacterium]|jgi:phosphatidylglycerophosphate synthase|nr:CDP-diacylglycerol---glycerol-3-phosphate 3-phosphatidyltransferase [Thermoanaerobaculia bacterium]